MVEKHWSSLEIWICNYNTNLGKSWNNFVKNKIFTIIIAFQLFLNISGAVLEPILNSSGTGN